MSSLNVVLTSDKAQFQNYFSDPIILPKNASVTMTKANLVLPVFVQNILRVPELTIAERGEVCLQVVIDGIYKDITWTDLFTAYSEYENITQIEPTLSANKFFSGTYEFWTNNYVYLEGSPGGTADGDKPKISWVISRAITNAFLFYEATDCSEYEDISIGIGNEPAGDPNVSITRPAFGGNPAVLYNNVLLNCNKKINTKLNIIYTPNDITELTTQTSTFAATDVKYWATGAGSLTSAVTGINVGYNNSADIDFNGGYMLVRPDLAAGGIMAWGFSLEGIGESANDKYLPRTYTDFEDATPVIDIGIQFESITEDATTYLVYKMIDGQNQQIHYNGANHIVEYYSVFKPNETICRFNSGDFFAMTCRRGTILNGSAQYIFEVLMGSGTDITTYKSVYTARKTLNSSALQIAPVFLSNAVANNTFTNIQYIQKSVDTIRQGQSKFNDDYAYHDSVKIQPVLDGRNNQEINWWSAIGLHSYHQSAAGQSNQSTKIVTYDGTPLNKNIGWKTNYKDQDNTNGNYSVYWIGKNKLSDFYKFDIVSETWVVRGIDDGGLAFLPKLLNVYLLNLTAKNYSGTYNNFQTIGAAVDTTNGEDRLVGTIPVDIEDTTAASELLIQYEPFNAYYRPLNNPDNYTINEFMVEVSFKDFTTDRRKTIDELIGIMKLEFNIKRGADPNVKKIMGMNGILPVI